jgi:hypothetical protein
VLHRQQQRPRPGRRPAPALRAATSAAPVTSVDLPLDLEEPDEVSEDLARLFAIRDANLPASGNR